MCPSLKATPQRKNQMQRRSTFETIIARGLLVGPVCTTLASRPRFHLLSVSFRFGFKSRGRQLFPFPLPPSPFPHPLYPNNTTALELEATEMLANPQREIGKRRTYICFPPKINLCCTGGIPSFSSTFSLICDTCISHRQHLSLSAALS
jgi:hypothetical protein